MSATVSFSTIGLVGMLAMLLAAAMVWLVLADPLTVARAVTEGDVRLLLHGLTSLVF